jgi:hypothetical protein
MVSRHGLIERQRAAPQCGPLAPMRLPSPMSALGQKQTLQRTSGMSALPPNVLQNTLDFESGARL